MMPGPIVLETATLRMYTPFAAVGFDASASRAGDGSTLQYVWDFGDGQRGGGARIAHVYANAGARTVTLTVIVVLASVAGVLAAVGPARRAAKLDILAAIASH